VVVVSADALGSQIETAMAAGARQYLTKPVSVSQLLGVVDAVLDDVETRFG
jgi:CheY-like chemotaxis protein